MDQILSLYQSVQNNLTPNIIIDIVKRAISQPHLYYFGEVRNKLRKTDLNEEQVSKDVERWLQVLDIFTYGEWEDYKALRSNSSDVPELDPIQVTKLKHLSLVSMAAKNRRLEYKQIAQYLEIDPKDLESFMVESIYNGLVVGKLDTKRQILEVNTVFGRDVSEQRLDEIENSLNQWVSRTESILNDTTVHVNDYRKQAVDRKKEVDAYNSTVERVNKELSKKKTAE